MSHEIKTLCVKKVLVKIGQESKKNPISHGMGVRYNIRRERDTWWDKSE